MIKIAHLVTGLSTGGSEMAIYRLVTRMERSRFTNIVISMTGDGPVAKLIRDEGISVYGLGMKPRAINPFGLLRMVRLLGSYRPDVLQTWLYHSDMLGLIASKMSGNIPVMWNIRCSKMDPKDHSLSLSLVIKALAAISRVPDGIIVNSNAGKMEHEKMGYNPKKWEIIPNGVDTKKYCPDDLAKAKLCDTLGVGKEKRLIGHVARYHPMKDHQTFLKAAKLISKNYPEVAYVMVGQGVDGNNARLRTSIDDLGLNAKAFLLGERDDVSEIMGAFDLLVSSSAYGEGFSNSIGEAMGCGVPCVVTDVGDSALIIGDTGRAVPPRDYHAIAQGCCELLSLSDENIKTLSQKARKRIIDNFSIEINTDRYEKLYEQMLEKR